MNEPETPTPIPQENTPRDTTKKGKGRVILVVVGCCALMSGLVIGLLWPSWSSKKQMEVGSSAAVSATPTPIFTGHGPSYIATQSAFLDLKSTIASLSSAIDTTTTTDTGIKPPTLDLPLGFTSN